MKSKMGQVKVKAGVVVVMPTAEAIGIRGVDAFELLPDIEPFLGAKVRVTIERIPSEDVELKPVVFEKLLGWFVVSRHATALAATADAPKGATVWTLTDEDTVIPRIRTVDSSEYIVVRKVRESENHRHVVVGWEHVQSVGDGHEFIGQCLLCWKPLRGIGKAASGRGKVTVQDE